jgi:hypothetical protein
MIDQQVGEHSPGSGKPQYAFLAPAATLYPDNPGWRHETRCG